VQRLGLVLFGGLFGLLFVAVAFGVGIGSASSVPSGAVAIVEGAPGGLRLITEAELDHEMKVQALERGLEGVPPASNPEYSALQREAMSKLVGVVWVEAQAEQMGLAPTPREIREKLSPGEGEAMRELGLTGRDVHDRMLWYESGDKIQEMLREGVPEASRVEISDYYEETPPENQTLAEARDEIENSLRSQREAELFNRVETKFRAQWRARTYCGDDFVVEECSNYPLFDHPETASPACYEADPKEPTEECPAPVIGTKASEPGSISWWRPEGERRVQRPIPMPEGMTPPE